MLDGDQVYGPRLPGIPPGRAAQRAPMLYWSLPTPLPDLVHALPAGPGTALNVYVNHGRWLVSCPTCQGSQFASRSDQRFFCADCGNIAVDGKWRQIVWPAAWKQIEMRLALRPLPENQNWYPGETLDDLDEENIRHGVVRSQHIITVPPFPLGPPRAPGNLGVAVSGEAALPVEPVGGT